MSTTGKRTESTDELVAGLFARREGVTKAPHATELIPVAPPPNSVAPRRRGPAPTGNALHRIASPIRSAFAASGLTESFAAERLKHFAEDSDSSWKRAPAVRATELYLRAAGILQADTQVLVDARSALLPVSVPPEALLSLLQQAASSE